jgi:hypothetical protein
VFDLEAVPLEHLRDPAGCLALLESRFRLRMDPMGKIDDLVSRGLDGGRQPGFGIGVRL